MLPLMEQLLREVEQLLAPVPAGTLPARTSELDDLVRRVVAAALAQGGETTAEAADRIASEALKIMHDKKINALMVVDSDLSVQGALNMHDLLRAGVV